MKHTWLKHNEKLKRNNYLPSRGYVLKRDWIMFQTLTTVQCNKSLLIIIIIIVKMINDMHNNEMLNIFKWIPSFFPVRDSRQLWRKYNFHQFLSVSGLVTIKMDRRTQLKIILVRITFSFPFTIKTVRRRVRKNESMYVVLFTFSSAITDGLKIWFSPMISARLQICLLFDAFLY